MRKRKFRGRKLKKQRKVIIVSVICLTLLLSTGYAAFSTNISLSAKGNIKEKPTLTASETITELVSDTTSNLITDDYGNIRYSGKDVNNYVCMENEVTCSNDNLYRIIGVFNNIKTSEDDAEGETRIKVIKATDNGSDRWDRQSSSSGWTGSNNWARPATLNTTLQSLAIASNSYVDNAVWNIGGHNSYLVTTKDMYNYERGFSRPSTGYPTTWTGKVALMYPSDYGYASSSCYSSKKLSEYHDSTCTGSNWLFPLDSTTTRSSVEWLLTPVSSDSRGAFFVDSAGYVNITYNVYSNSFAVRPSFYLKSNVAIKEDSERNGSLEHPYLLELIEEEN